MFVVLRDNVDGDDCDVNTVCTIEAVDEIRDSSWSLEASVEVKDGENLDVGLEGDLGGVDALLVFSGVVDLEAVWPNDARWDSCGNVNCLRSMIWGWLGV